MQFQIITRSAFVFVGYQFDASGNTKQDAENRQFIYDAENKQVEVKDQSGASIGKYFYDGDGKRVKKISASETTIFIYDASGKMVAEYSTAVASQQDAKVSYLTNDHLGSPRITTDANGQVISRRDFQPFGEEIARASYGADNVRQKFTGYERDNETDLDFAQARMYNKGHGRFTRPDEPFMDQSEDDPQSWNLYLYAGNNPLLFTDPTGMWKWSDPDSNGYRFVEWEDGDNWNTLRTFIYNETGDFYSESSLANFYSGTGALEVGLIVDLGNFDGTPLPGPHGLEDASLDIIPLGKGGRIVEKTGIVEKALRAIGLGAAKKGTKKVVIRKNLNVLQNLCFVAGTQILTETGLKAIEEIKEGDKVLSYNEKTKQTEYKTVVQTMVREAEAGRILSLKVEGEAEALGVTGEHPFYVRVHGARSNLASEDDDGKWIEAGNLKVGDEIRKADGSWSKVETVTQRKEGAKVYNFSVKDNYNYFVGQTSLY